MSPSQHAMIVTAQCTGCSLTMSLSSDVPDAHLSLLVIIQ